MIANSDQNAKRLTDNLAFCMFLYWAVLLVWQNFFTYDKSSGMTTIIKVGLLFFLCLSFYSAEATIKPGAFCVWTLWTGITLVSMLLTGNSLMGANVIFYLFPSVLLFLALVLRADYALSRSGYLLFLHLILGVVFCMVVYSLLFQWDYYLDFLQLEKSYGYELSSFMTSNHEYGMYLVFGITAGIICYQNTDRPFLHLLYVLLLTLFGINLVLTLSRTSYLAVAVLVISYIITASSGGTRKWLLFAIAVMVILVFTIPGGTDFFVRILLKENNDAGRAEMWTTALDKYRDGTFLKQLFGFGYSEILTFTKTTFAHSTIHNTYIQVLLVWGLFGLLFLIIAQIYSIAKAVRLFHHDRNMAAVFLALSLSQIAFQFTNTACLFESVIDSFMLTAFTLIVPIYVGNSIIAGTYLEPAEPAPMGKANAQ